MGVLGEVSEHVLGIVLLLSDSTTVLFIITSPYFLSFDNILPVGYRRLTILRLALRFLMLHFGRLSQTKCTSPNIRNVALEELFGSNDVIPRLSQTKILNFFKPNLVLGWQMVPPTTT